MSNPRDDETSLAQVYQELKDETYEAEEANRADTAEAYLLWINRHLSPGRLLDVGCSTGFFLSRAASSGWLVSGIEPSAWSAAKAHQRVPQANLFNGRLEAYHSPTNSFDLVTFWDVLEHVPSPTGAFQTIHPWLAEGGYLALNLPDSSSLMARTMGNAWVLYLREHLWYFSPQTITQLLHKVGFEVIQIKPNAVRFSMANIFIRLSQYRGLAHWVGKTGGQMPVLPRLSFRFPMGEMNVLARKR